jgi:hypothetical protein
MPHYQALLFGCASPRAGLAECDTMSEIELLWDWIERLSRTARIPLDWPANTILITPLGGEQADDDDILGVVIAISDSEARPLDYPLAPLFELLPKDAGPGALAELCLPLSTDIQTALLRWEIVRFSARGIGLDLPAGRLFLVEGWFDEPMGARPPTR